MHYMIISTRAIDPTVKVGIYTKSFKEYACLHRSQCKLLECPNSFEHHGKLNNA